MTNYWWKNAVIYGVDVERFCDGDGDGIGDFKGLTSKVPYIAELGVTCIWLLPFFPSSDRDNGYDITDYFRVDSKYGQFGDFLSFLHTAGEHSLRVVIDLVTQHTSDQHPWFQAARNNEESRYRDYYVWAQHPPPVQPGKGNIFPGEESSVWRYDEVARAYYHHRFYHFEPGLNTYNPHVRAEIERIVDYWTSFGIAGFRIDAASHMLTIPDEDLRGAGDPHDILRELFRDVKEHAPNAVLLGEVDEPPAKLKAFFDGEQLNMMFDFLLQNYLTLALADESAEPIKKGLALLPEPPENGQWATFIRNLDEADLEQLAPDELERTFAAFAPEENMRIYGRGIRRRLAPMLGGDERRMKLAFSLLFSLPGAPLFVYGDEIGMGDDLSQHGRNTVRSPMQWSAERNAGFSSAPEDNVVQPVIGSGPFSYKRTNVEAARGSPDSLLSFVKQLSKLRRVHPAAGQFPCEIMDAGSEQVFAHRYTADGSTLLMLHNLSGKPAKVDLQLDPASAGSLQTLLGGEIPALSSGRLGMQLEPYGVRWAAQGRHD